MYFNITDADECRYNNGNCSHICVNTTGSYYCECPPGYTLQPNQHDCQGEYTYICSYNSAVNCNVLNFET